MSHLKLIKLLYLADREALLRWSYPITTDQYFSMRRGPVLSNILDLINEGSASGEERIWETYISPRANHEVSLIADPPDAELSKAERALLREIFDQYAQLDRWALVDIVHEFGEWQSIDHGRSPIEYVDIFRAGGMTEAEAREMDAELAGLAAADCWVNSTWPA